MTFAAELARQQPGQVAIRCGDISLTWEQADGLLRPLTNRLYALDLGPQRRVAVFAGNAAQTVLAYAAITLAGGSAVAVNSHLTAAEAAYILSDSHAAAIFVDAVTEERGRAAAIEAGVATVLTWPQWLAAGTDEEPRTDVPPRPSLVYTSGTTGRPKGTELPPTAFVGGADIAEHLERLKGNSLAGYGHHLVVGPMYHSGPLVGTRLFLAGVPITVMPRFDAEAVLAAIDHDRIGSAVMVPVHFQRILELPDDVRGRYDLSSLRFVLQVGAKCPSTVKQAIIDWWGPVVWESYGASEVGTVCQISSADWLAHPGSVGQAIPPFEAIVVDDDGDPVPPGVTGRLFFRDGTGRGIVYHNKSADSVHSEPGVFTLGEIGYQDPDGFVYITDRHSDMVVSGGVNIYPAESEQVLSTHPGISEVCCIGIPDEKMGERVLALVVRRDPELTETDVLEYCRARLTHYKCPKAIAFVGALTRTPVGKIDKRAMRAPYWNSGGA